MTEHLLMQEAVTAMKRAYAPYSGFFVGAALLTADGRVYTGCNIENASFTPTVCAERTALFNAVSDGVREFTMLAIAGGKGGNIAGICPPCGVCRQVLAEFCPPEFPILLLTADRRVQRVTLGELLPYSFSLEGAL